MGRVNKNKLKKMIDLLNIKIKYLYFEIKYKMTDFELDV